MKNVLRDISLSKTTLILFCTLISSLGKFLGCLSELVAFYASVFLIRPHTTGYVLFTLVENESLSAQTNLTSHSQ